MYNKSVRLIKAILPISKRWVILLMTLSLFSCFKPMECPEPIEDTKTITVKIQLPDYSSRATVEAPLTGVGVVVRYVDVYFYNIESGVVHTKASLSMAEIIDISSGEGMIFSDLNDGVDGVAVIANNNANKGIDVAQGESIYDLFSKELDVKHEQMIESITLYGKRETFIEIKPQNSAPNVGYYTTDVTIKPLVARMEISNVSCTDIDVEGLIQSLSLHSIFMDNTYQHVVLDAEEPVISSLFVADVEAVEFHTLNWWIYSYTYGFPEIPSNDPANTFSPDVDDPTLSGDGVFAFHFIPSDLTPLIRLYMIANNANHPYYLHIENYTKENTRVIFDPGYIYKITVPFVEDDVTTFDDHEQSITVEVEVQEWTIIDDILPA